MHLGRRRLPRHYSLLPFQNAGREQRDAAHVADDTATRPHDAISIGGFAAALCRVA